jgi:hypothetical protein
MLTNDTTTSNVYQRQSFDTSRVRCNDGDKIEFCASLAVAPSIEWDKSATLCGDKKMLFTSVVLISGESTIC